MLIDHIRAFTVMMKVMAAIKAKAEFAVSERIISIQIIHHKINLLIGIHRQRRSWMGLWLQPVFLLFWRMFVTSLWTHVLIAHAIPNSCTNTADTCADTIPLISANKGTYTCSYTETMVRSNPMLPTLIFLCSVDENHGCDSAASGGICCKLSLFCLHWAPY